jgi:hypothetical protein
MEELMSDCDGAFDAGAEQLVAQVRPLMELCESSSSGEGSGSGCDVAAIEVACHDIMAARQRGPEALCDTPCADTILANLEACEANPPDRVVEMLEQLGSVVITCEAEADECAEQYPTGAAEAEKRRVMQACCGDAVGACTVGGRLQLPSTCSRRCAGVLVPFFDTCPHSFEEELAQMEPFYDMCIAAVAAKPSKGGGH